MKYKSINIFKVMQICIALLFIVYNTLAQLWTTDNVNVTITSGTQLTVQGDVQNQNAATITNNGTIDLSGNWIHNAANNCFGAGISTGSVILNGANQNIGGTNSTTFNNLTFIGSGTKTLQQDITVGGATTPTGILSIGDRNLDLNSHALIISNPLPVGITRNTAFIISETQPIPGYGFIKWNIANSAAGNNYTFPFGNATTGNYLPLNFNITAAGTGAGNGYVKISTYPTNTALNPNNRPFPTGLTALINNNGLDNSSKVVDRYFIFDVQGYTTAPVSTMIFPYRDLEWNTGTNVIAEANLKMQRLNNGTQWTQPPFGTVNTVANTVTVTAQNNYSPIWTIVDLTSPLPVALLDFTALLNPLNQTDLMWSTVIENNSSNFEVQKSNDAQHFQTFDVIESHHFSNSINNYKSLDANPNKGITYYRLKQNDLNGDYTFSKTIAVQVNDSHTAALSLYPNPMNDFSTVIISNTEGVNDNCTLVLINLLGQKITEQKLSTIKTSTANSYSFNRGNIAAGIYYLNLMDNEKQLDVIKLIIQ